jgi:hypothetical protein
MRHAFSKPVGPSLMIKSGLFLSEIISVSDHQQGVIRSAMDWYRALLHPPSPHVIEAITVSAWSWM